ncbi:hypothetical protein EAH77_18355 [Ewingella americana]|uniref:Uncharacterized protein n=1 Tax=Ewingella americana TaxID=41202 RepID=A0A502GBZ9_9GAMM|nr:hypothetical protein EAH77_18355 [Ewingella americana]
MCGKTAGQVAYQRGIRIDFSRPGTPADNATAESFNEWLKCLYLFPMRPQKMTPSFDFI